MKPEYFSRPRDEGILDRARLRFFIKKSLQRTWQSHGCRIHEMRGINGAFSRPALGGGIAAGAAIVPSLGYFSDIRHLRFAFRATLDVAGRASSAAGETGSAKKRGGVIDYPGATSATIAQQPVP
jgi:hypothetical protein